jgi:hypothetical protein
LIELSAETETRLTVSDRGISGTGSSLAYGHAGAEPTYRDCVTARELRSALRLAEDGRLVHREYAAPIIFLFVPKD